MDYSAGTTGQAGIGFRISSSSVFNEGDEVRWGMIDVSNAMFFGRDPDGLFVAIINSGVRTSYYRNQGEWKDALDGTGPSGLSLDLDFGYIYQIDYTWYGYGTIDFSINVFDEENLSVPVVVKKT